MTGVSSMPMKGSPLMGWMTCEEGLRGRGKRKRLREGWVGGIGKKENHGADESFFSVRFARSKSLARAFDVPLSTEGDALSRSEGADEDGRRK